jgi:4-amino-4-deoxy-L-arabinose transferase-like glycosyltransferase
MAKSRDISGLELGFIALAAFFIFFTRLQSLELPMDRDEGTYAYIAQGLSSHMMPYRDTFDHKPPLAYFLYKSAFDIFGTDREAVRNFTTACVVLTMLLVYMFARIYSGGFGAMLAAFLYALYQQNFMLQGLGSNIEIFTQFPLAASMLFLADREKKYEHINFFIAGFFAAIAFFIKPMVGFFAAAALLYIIFYSSRRVRNPAWFIAGFITVAAGTAAWAFKNGIFGEFYSDVFTYNIAYASRWNDPELYKNLFRGGLFYIRSSIIGSAAVAYFIYRIFREPKNGLNFLLPASALSLYAGIIVLKGAYPHYYLTLAAVTAIAGGIMTQQLYRMMSKHGRIRAAIFAALFIASTTWIYLDTIKAGRAFTGRNFIMPVFYDAATVSGLINNSKDPNTTLFVWPNEPEIYFLTGIKAPVKYIYSYPIEGDKAALDRVTAEVYARPPAYIVLEKGQEGGFTGLLNAAYIKAMDTNTLTLYRRK